MVIEGERIMYRNVVWHSYKVHYTEFEKALADFNKKLIKAKLTINGPIFYVLHNFPLDEIMNIDIYVPVEQRYVSRNKGLLFQTYYYIDNMLMSRVKGDFEVNTEIMYAEMFHYIEENNLQIASPMYHVLRGDDELQWVELKLKVFVEDNEESDPVHEENFLNKYI